MKCMSDIIYMGSININELTLDDKKRISIGIAISRNYGEGSFSYELQYHHGDRFVRSVAAIVNSRCMQ